MTRLSFVFLAVMALGLLAACGSGPTCLSICQQATANGCPPAHDCARYCTAADNVASKGGCNSQYATYKTCAGALQGSNVCMAFMSPGMCQSEQQAVTTCGLTYCAANPTDADCMTLASNP